MKRIIAIILLLHLSIISGYNVWQWISYKMNQDVIAKTLCENKGKPELHCEGMCHLSKQLKKTEEKAPKSSNSKYKKINVFLYLGNVVKSTICNPSNVTKYTFTSERTLDGYSKINLPPPKV